MSSSQVGVQAHIKARAPDPDYQGCTLHSLNFVICNLTKIPFIQNVFAKRLLFFLNSLKQQRFLEFIIKAKLSGGKEDGLCKTRWVERHTRYIY